MAGRVSDELSGEVVCLSAENMDNDSATVAESEGLLSKGDHLDMLSVTVNEVEAPSELLVESSKQIDVVSKDGAKLDAEPHMNCMMSHQSKSAEDGGEKTVESSLEAEKLICADVVVEAQADAQAKAEKVAVAEVAVADDKDRLDHNVIDNFVEARLPACSTVAKESSSDLLGQKVAVIVDVPSQVAATTVTGDVASRVTDYMVDVPSQCADTTAAQDMNKETPEIGIKQDELPVLADKDGSTGSDEPSSSAPCTEVSVTATQESAGKQSASNINSSEATCIVTGEESKIVQDPQVTSLSKKDDSFSFDLPKKSEGDMNKVSQPLTTSQDLSVSETVVSSSVAFSSTPKNKKRSQKIFQGVKESSEHKRRQSTARKGGKKGDQPGEASLLKQLDGGERTFNISTSVGSNLPTLNFSAFQQPAAFQQPFTDLQQLQLRAQILVYGFLIQGNTPDEGCLVSAFGGPDGGRSIWEKPWRKSLERIHSQRSQINMKIPVLQSSGKSTPDQTTKRKRNANLPTLGSAAKSDSSHTVNPMIQLSSPIWNIHTSSPGGLRVSEIQQASFVDHIPLPPLYPPAKSTGYVAPSSHASHTLPSVASAQSSLWNPNTPLSVLPSVEPVRLFPVKESSLFPQSTANLSSAGLSPSSIAAPVISSQIVGEPQVFKSPDLISKVSKAKKPKKVSVSKNACQILKAPSNSSEPVLANLGSKIRPASTKACPLPEDIVLTSSPKPLLSSDPISVEDQGEVKEDKASEDALHRVNEAKLQAEEAAACAEAAVSHSQFVWDQLGKQKNSGLPADLESKVASAAVAIAAAVSVSKAAAAAAKLASEAAVQAKLMVEESLISSGCINIGSVNEVALSDGVNLLDEVTPASILKTENSANNSTSIIGVAKEAARRKIESALYASKHAKNLDAIVKAAGLAAEAVAQAGRVVAMGDPLPLNALVHSGPASNRKLSQQSQEQLAVANPVKIDLFNSAGNGGNLSFSMKSQDVSLSSQPPQHSKPENQPAPKLASQKDVDIQLTTADLVPNSNEDLLADAVVCSQMVCEKKHLSSHQESGNIVKTSLDNQIVEGSAVEVFKEWGTVKAAWFSARVLELKGDEVCVSYFEKQTGGGEYKEWINLSSEDNAAPIVRITHPIIGAPSDGARKRRRSAIGRQSWEVGDKVDAWMQDCWWEGLVIEKNSKDGSLLTVQFPAQGETCVVKAWNLRPSLIWKDGAWVQWSNPVDSIRTFHEDDMPRGKRRRLSRPQIDVKRNGKASESSLKSLSENETKLNVGKSTQDDAKVNAKRMVRTGLRTGSKVIFGVPKPERKRKFMDVGNTNKPHKTSRIPVSRGPHGLKNSTPGIESQLKTTRSMPKDSFGKPIPTEVDEDRELHHITDNDSSTGIETQAEPESFPVADEATDDSILISSLAPSSFNPSSKRSALGNIKSKRANREKLGLSHVQKVDVEEEKVFSGTTQQEAPDATEPRRSYRRIQPTSRLLEGLQTSLSIAKVPATGNRK